MRPKGQLERHTEVGFELLLDPVVPQLGRELVEVPNVVSQVLEQNVDIPVPSPRLGFAGTSQASHGHESLQLVCQPREARRCAQE